MRNNITRHFVNWFGIIAVGFAVFGATSSAEAKDIYIAQSDTGTADGTSSANARCYSWFNNSANWGSGVTQINPGDIVHLCGIITNMIAIKASGTVANPITILFELNASLSQPSGTLAHAQNVSNIIFDGGVNGLIENTANGTAFANKLAVSGIDASGSHNLEVKNLTFRNLYIHTSTNDGAAYAFDSNGALYMNGVGNNISVHNCTFSNICWVLNFQGCSGCGMNVYSNYFLNFDHGVAGLGNSYSNVNIYNNHFGSTANWDTSANRWHHDGIHVFFGETAALSNVKIYDNLFDGDWGMNNTAYMYFEGDYAHTNAPALANFTIFNNLFIEYSANILNNGFIVGGGPNWALYNNTFLGSGVAGSLGLSVAGRGTNVVVENNLFSGLNTFIKTVNSCVLGCNIYANAVSGGNSPWVINGTSYSLYSIWQAASGETKSFYTNSVPINSNGSFGIASSAIGSGMNLAAIFTTDISGTTRNAPWDIGAYAHEVISPPTSLQLVPTP